MIIVVIIITVSIPESSPGSFESSISSVSSHSNRWKRPASRPFSTKPRTSSTSIAPPVWSVPQVPDPPTGLALTPYVWSFSYIMLQHTPKAYKNLPKKGLWDAQVLPRTSSKDTAETFQNLRSTVAP